MHLARRYRTPAILLAAGALTLACVMSTTTRPVSLAVRAPARQVKTPLKVHLLDGSVIVFANGATIDSGQVRGTGERYDATRSTLQRQSVAVPLDSVLGLETYERQINPGRTLLYSGAATAVGAAATAALAVAIFGSCPTIYADSAGTQALQAEAFSNAIVPLLAHRDVDRLTAVADARGVVRLEVRDEALETHHLDQLELVELRHRADETALPASGNAIVAVADVVAPASARDGAGRDVRATVAATDGAAFATDERLLARAIDGGPEQDHIDLAIPRAGLGDSVAIVLRARASLLSTAVLYEHMLGRPGASALDWMGGDLARITTLAHLANWYADNFALRVAVRDGESWKPAARMVDFGPAAWRDVAVVVPAVGDDSVRVRLSFLADELRFDRIAFARRVRGLEQSTVRIARVTDAAGRPRDAAADALRRADSRELETHPGDRYFAEFDVGAAAAGTRTFMVASHGYYTEWIRGRWVMAATDTLPFSPSRAPVRELLRSWRVAKDTLEQRFFVRRVPIT